MPERLSSFMILMGGLLAIVALWGLSVMAVRWDTNRRNITQLERRAWMALTILLPLFGFGIYLFMRVLRRYLTPQTGSGADSQLADARARVDAYHASPVQQRVSPAERGTASAQAANWPAAQPPYAAGQRAPQTMPAPYQQLKASYALVAADGPHLGQQFILNRLPAQIGRGPEMAVPLDADMNVSRHHAEVYEWNGALRIRDLHSMHGTLVNGKKISDQPLMPGDRVSLGSTVLVLRDSSSPPA